MLQNKPWHKFYSGIPKSIDYPSVTMYESVMRSVKRVPDKIVADYQINEFFTPALDQFF